MSIKGLVFDMDGVITETARYHFKAWKHEVIKLGINYTKEENQALKGLSRLDTLKGILRIHNRTDISEAEMLKIANQKNERYLKFLKTELSTKDILPGVLKFLDNAKEKGLVLAIASSSYNAPIILEKIGLLDRFEFIVYPGEIIHGKPAPDIYLAACKGIKLDPSEVIGFEDAMPGVEGLLKANIKTVAITWGDKGDWNKAQMVLKSTSQLDLETIISL